MVFAGLEMDNIWIYLCDRDGEGKGNGDGDGDRIRDTSIIAIGSERKKLRLGLMMVASNQEEVGTGG